MHHFSERANGGRLLCRIDPRIKLLSALSLLMMVLGSDGFVFPLLTAGLCTFLCLSTGIPMKAVVLRFAEPAFIIVMVVLLKLFSAGHSAIFTFDFFGLEITAYREGMVEGLLISARIAGAVTTVAALGFATPFTELAAALAWLRIPRAFTEIALFAWRYLFLLSDDAKVIYEAQKNRLGYSGYLRGLRSFGTLTGSLVIKAFDNSRNVTTAMVQRGYDGDMPMLKNKPFKASEVTCSVLFIAAMVIVRQAVKS